MKNISFGLLFLLLVQTATSQVFENTFAQFSSAYTSERIHIHYDKSSYGAGDTIWFKAYLMKGVEPENESKTLYIDWSDPSGKLISRSSWPIMDGITYGQLSIPKDYASSTLEVKAYTKWMLNFDSAFLYDRYIRILNTPQKAVKDKEIAHLTLFPEGGNLVGGLINNVAFKATDQYGNPIKLVGQLMEDGKVLKNITSVHDGMGSFSLAPVEGKSYSIGWKDATGIPHNTSLPPTERKGLLLKITRTNDSRNFFIQVNDSSVAGRVRVIGTMYQHPVFNIEKNLVNNTAQGVIPVQMLPSGVLVITVLDEQYHPLAERITFIDNGEYVFTPEMNVTHWGLNRRARNEIEISVPDSIEADLSVSVTDANIDFNDENTILSDLLLSSELKGKIYHPAYYFTNQNDTTASFLDLVMLTNGWRKISWTDLAVGKLPQIKFPKDTAFNSVSGKIYGATPNQLQNAGDMVLIVNQKDNKQFVTVPINPDGSFRAKELILFDTATIYYQPPKNKTLNNVTVQFLDNRLPVSPQTGYPSPSPTFSDTSGMARHARLSDEMQDFLKTFQAKVLDAVTIKAKTKTNLEKMDEKYTSGLFSGGQSRDFDLINDPATGAYLNIFSYMQGKVAGLMITPGTPPSLTWRGGTPALFLDEMPVSAEMLANIPVSDVAYIKALNPPFMGATGGGPNGAIAVYTRKGNDVASTPGKGLSKNTVTGYSIIRQFYSPNYVLGGPADKDLRTTLYWNPEVILKNGTRKTTLTFYNNDISGSFRIVIEGMTPDGRLAHVVKIME